MLKYISIRISQVIYLLFNSSLVIIFNFTSFVNSLFSSFASGSNVKEFVESVLKNKKVVVFSKSYCPFCQKAKDVLTKYNLPSNVYEIVEIDGRDDESDIQAYMGKKTGGESVRIFTI